MANYEYADDIGNWFYRALITSPKLVTMSTNEEANHQNKPRSCVQFESTYVVNSESSGEFLTIAQLEPEYTALLFGVHVVDSDGWTGTTYNESLLFPTGPGIGPFTRPPVVNICTGAFAVPDANGGRSWQALNLAGATDESSASRWLLAVIGQPFTAGGYNNYRSGMPLLFRTAGFDGQSPNAPSANTNYYVFWHAVGPVAAYS